MIKGGFTPNQLVFGRNPGIASLTGELTPVLTKKRRRGGLFKEHTGGNEDG